MNKFLTIETVEKVCFVYASERMSFNEPFPPFSSRYPGKLESAIEAPMRSFGGVLMYKTLEEQAAVLFYELTKLHPFENGNKRMAVVSTFIFLYLNDRWLMVTHDELYQTAIGVASSDARDRENVLKELFVFFRQHIIDAKMT
ncbi:MAG TPA: type II toxin-antitoxin system death-on-curing family toxin [Candidatus Methylomirabilis sp.]|nr:type II toxin-antitoxin system death-on-curing family toxin [Candidatus Methylomirabilis sp.]